MVLIIILQIFAIQIVKSNFNLDNTQNNTNSTLSDKDIDSLNRLMENVLNGTLNITLTQADEIYYTICKNNI